MYKAELSVRADSETTKEASGYKVCITSVRMFTRKTISYCIKDASGQVQRLPELILCCGPYLENSRPHPLQGMVARLLSIGEG